MIYRIDTISRLGAKIGTKQVNYRTDADAIEAARQMRNPHILEVWCGKRKVATLEADAEQSN